MSFIQKYKNSVDVAQYAYDKDYFDVAVNRYYYGIYQKILNALEINNINVANYDIDERNTHNKTLDLFRDEVFLKKITGKQKEIFKKRTDLNSGLRSLKSLRCISDYKADLLTEEQAKEALSTFKALDSIIE